MLLTVRKRIEDLIFFAQMNLVLSLILTSTLTTSLYINHIQVNNFKAQILRCMEKRVAIDTIVLKKDIDTAVLEKKIFKSKPMLPIDSNYITVGVDVRATVYNAVEEQCDSDPSHTAFMFKLDLKNPFKHRIIAVSRDLEKHFPNNTKVRLEGTAYDGIYTVKDRMHSRCRRQIDILINKEMPVGNWHGAKIFKM